MVKYEDLTLEQIDFIRDTDVVCDGDKKEVMLIERNNENE